MNERVHFEVSEDHVGIVRLTRPDKLNALDLATFAALHEVEGQIREAIAARACRSVLVTGAGRAFCSGLDVSLFGRLAGGADALDQLDWLQRSFTLFEDLPVPTVAALHGLAFGGGLQLALACHLRVGTADVRLALLETRWGIIPDLGATYRLPRLVGLGRATELAVTAREITGATAEQWGLLNDMLPADGFADAAHAYAARLASGPTVATGALPRLLREAQAVGREGAMREAGEAQWACLSSEDFREAAAAGLQGRPPVFRGV